MSWLNVFTTTSSLLIGTMGLASLLAAKAYGATEVCITGRRKLETAKQLGADYTIKVTSENPKELARKIEEVMGELPDLVIECVGTTDCMKLAIYATKAGGSVSLVGCISDEVTFPLMDAIFKETKITALGAYANRYPIALAMVASGKVNMKPLVTHRFQLKDAVKAFEAVQNKKGIKVMVECGKD